MKYQMSERRSSAQSERLKRLTAARSQKVSLAGLPSTDARPATTTRSPPLRPPRTRNRPSRSGATSMSCADTFMVSGSTMKTLVLSPSCNSAEAGRRISGFPSEATRAEMVEPSRKAAGGDSSAILRRRDRVAASDSGAISRSVPAAETAGSICSATLNLSPREKASITASGASITASRRVGSATVTTACPGATVWPISADVAVTIPEYSALRTV